MKKKRSPQEEHELFEFWIKVIFVAFVFALFIILPHFARAQYQSSPEPTSASSSSTLTLEILPTQEFLSIQQQTSIEDGELLASYSSGIRANTSWEVEIVPLLSPGLHHPPICSSSVLAGSRNLDNDYQELTWSCRQELSAADLFQPAEIPVLVLESSSLR